MNLPSQIQQEVAKWATIQGIDPEQFITQAVIDKINLLNRETETQPSEQPNTYYEGTVLVVDAKLPSGFDLNQFIDELREEQINLESWI